MSLPADGKKRPAPDGVCFVMWGFPEPTQTFIHREYQEMLRQGMRVRILAGDRLPADKQPDDVRAIAEESTIWLGDPVAWFFKGLLAGTFSRLPFWRTQLWMASFPHRSLLHRLRAAAMVCAAASVASKVRAAGVRHLHAQFGSYPTELAMALARMLGLTYGGTWHAVDIWKDANILREKIAESAVVFTCTKFNADHLREVAGDAADKVVLSYHGLDFSRLPEPAPIPEEEIPSVVAVGRLVPKKGFAFLLRALASLKESGFPVRLRLVGEGPLEAELRKSAEELGIAELVEFAGALPNAETLRVVNESQLLVAPSIRDRQGNIDGIPNVPREALALGRPVVGTRLSGIPEVVNGETGALVEPEDADGLAAAIRSLLEDRDGLVRRGAAAREFVLARFDIRKNIRVQLDFLSDLLR